MSAFGVTIDNMTVGSHKYVCRLLKGIYNERPATARYEDTWDVDLVLKYWKDMQVNANLSLKELTFKLIILIAVITAARIDTMSKLTLENMKRTQDSVILFLDKPLKQSKVGEKLQTLELKAFPSNRKISVVSVLEEYIQRTAPLRKSNKLFVSLNSPHREVGKQSLARWIRSNLQNAGIDVQKYGPYSTRGASVSKAKAKFVPVDEILNTGGWKRRCTFSTFYDLKILKASSYAANVLS